MRNKGNVPQQYEKYIKLAKEASTSSDRIQSEYYYQFADHYYRLMIELGINIEEDNNNESFETRSNDNKENNENTVNNENSEAKLIEEKQVEEPDDHESIESVTFISEPIKKKVAKFKKT